MRVGEHMRKQLVGLAVGVMALTLTACSSTPESLFTVDQARSVLISTNADAESLEALLSDQQEFPQDGVPVREYVAALAMPDAIDPGECGDATQYIVMPSKDADRTDTLLQVADLWFVSDGQVAPVVQTARVFATVEEADQFVSSYRDTMDGCSDVRVAAEAGTIALKYSTGSLPFDRNGFLVAEEIATPDGETSNGERYIIRKGNLVALVAGTGESVSEGHVELVAAAVASRMDGKFDAAVSDSDAQSANQSVAEACEKFSGITYLTSTDAIWNAYTDSDVSSFGALVSEWQDVAAQVTNAEVSAGADAVVQGLQELQGHQEKPDLGMNDDSYLPAYEAVKEGLNVLVTSGCSDTVAPNGQTSE